MAIAKVFSFVFFNIHPLAPASLIRWTSDTSSLSDKASTRAPGRFFRISFVAFGPPPPRFCGADPNIGNRKEWSFLPRKNIGSRLVNPPPTYLIRVIYQPKLRIALIYIRHHTRQPHPLLLPQLPRQEKKCGRHRQGPQYQKEISDLLVIDRPRQRQRLLPQK